MGFLHEEVKRAEATGYYTSYNSNARDILDFITADISHVEESKPSYIVGTVFKVTIIVEEI